MLTQQDFNTEFQMISFSDSAASISRKSRLVTVRQLSIRGNVGTSFWWLDVFPDASQIGLGKRNWNLATSSKAVSFHLHTYY